MALTAQSLTTLAVLKAEVGIGTGTTTHDSRLERLIEVASEAIAVYVGRPLHYSASYAERLEIPDGTKLLLSRTPLAASSPITSIVVDGVTVTSTTYEVEDYDLGIVNCDAGWTPQNMTAVHTLSGVVPGTSPRLLVATYKGGWVTLGQVTAGPPALVRDLPWEIEQAAIDTAASLWRRAGVDRASAAYQEQGQQYGGGVIPGSVLPSLNRYRRLVR